MIIEIKCENCGETEDIWIAFIDGSVPGPDEGFIHYGISGHCNKCQGDIVWGIIKGYSIPSPVARENSAMRKAIEEVLNSNPKEIQKLIRDYEVVGQDNFVSIQIKYLRKLKEAGKKSVRET